MIGKSMKRVVSLLLVLVMLVSYMPSVYATETEPATEPVVTEPVVTEPVVTEPVVTEPVVTEPVVTEPVVTEPVVTEPVVTEPVVTEPEVTEPVVTEPVVTEPVVTEPEVTEPEVTEPTEATEPVETEPTEPEATEPEETDPTDPTEETEPTDPTEETEPTEPEEEIELPYGFPGMPEGYVLSEEELAAKASLVEDKAAEILPGLTAGEDYVENELIFTCDDESYAAMVAAAYNAELVDCSYGVATICLQSATVVEAVTAASDMELPLPAVYPNYISKLIPVEGSGSSNQNQNARTFSLPQRQSWETWVFENLDYPDPYISDPKDSLYQYHHDVINTYEAWGVTTGDPDIKVAVIDTGYTNHSDFVNNEGYRNVGYYVIDSSLGYKDEDGHGTSVAGLIGASLNNGKGGAGIAPGVSVISIKAGVDGFSSANVAKAIRAAVQQDADIINMSLGGPYPNKTEREAVEYAINAGVTIVAAMGNDGTNIVQYPAAYDGVIGVACTDSANQRACYSNYGSYVDVSAPGHAAPSTMKDGGYDYFYGTSSASPIVAGVCALYMSAVGHVDPATMEKVLEASCNKISGSGMGAGVVDAAKMFDKTVDMPTVYIFDGQYYYYTENGDIIYCDEYIDFGSDINDDNHTLIYTINGKTPSIKNGKIVNGIQYNGKISMEPYKGKTITIRAAAVTGMGNISKVVTRKLKVAASSRVTGVDITAPEKLIAGKSVKLTATVLPAETADQSVTWSITGRNGNTAGVTIGSDGTLKAPKGQSGSVTVVATSKVSGIESAGYKISIVSQKPIATIKLNTSKLSCYVGETQKLSVATLLDSGKNSLNPNDCDLQWISSNTKVATVDQNGNVTAHAKGTATITCKALDGSNKYARCTVTVKQQITHIEITGQSGIASGASATMKAVVSPSNVTSKSVTWSLRNAPAGTTISSKGVVKVPKGVSAGTTFYVTATAKDGKGAYAEKMITVAPKATAVTISLDAIASTNSYTESKSGKLTGVNLVNIEGYAGDDGIYRNRAYFSASATGNNYAQFQWSSSNTKVASVDQNGRVYAHTKGTATITCKALDGSGKKASFKVTVTVPVSTVTIKTSAPQMTFNDPCIAFGKSTKNSVVFGDTYGKPSNTKVTWSFEAYMMSQSSYTDVTDYVKEKKLVSLSSSGTLKTSSGLYNLWRDYNPGSNPTSWKYDVVIFVTATAEDGGISDEVMFYAIPKTTKLKCVDLDNGKMSSSISYYCYLDAEENDYSWYYNTYYLKIYSDQIGHSYYDGNYFFTASSSNPNVAGVVGITPVYDDNDNIEKNYYWVEVVTHKKGKAKITVKTADGTNLSCSFNLTVK